MATILIIDDNADTRLLVRTVLTSADHMVVEAADGKEGLAKAAETRPDLILLDLSLPSMSGAELVRALHADERTRATAVALYTASPMTAVLRDFMEIYDIRRVIPKPSEPLELLRAIEDALRPSLRKK